MSDFVSIDIKGLDELTKNLDPQLFSQTFNRVVNDVVPSVAVEALRQTKKQYYIGTSRLKVDIDGKSKYVKPQTWAFQRVMDKKIPKRAGRVKFVPAKIIDNNATAHIKIDGVAIPLSLFVTNPNYGKIISKGKRVPIRVKVKKGGIGMKRQKIRYRKTGKTESLFRAKFKSGHEGIFFRDSTITKTKQVQKKTKIATVKYNPLREANSITPTTMILNLGEKGGKSFENIINQVWDKRAYPRYEHYLNLLSKGFWKKR